MRNLSPCYQISIPSKTFLIGEYAVLDGASALIASTTPYFNFKVNMQSSKLSHPFHSESAAGIYIEKNREIFSQIQIELMEKRPSGFGLSSAEWNCVVTIASLLKNDVSVYDLWKEYVQIAKNTSGADVVAQKLGGLCHFCMNPFTAENLIWSFSDIHFAFILTGESLETWKHLKDFKKESLDRLKNISHLSVDALKNKDEKKFIQSIKDYDQELQKKSWITPATRSLLEELKLHSEVLALKGCGALGAESVVFFFRKENKEKLFQSIQKKLSFKQSIREGNLSKGILLSAVENL